jgi:hypothetical protein
LNNSQVIAIYNDEGLANLTLNVHALYNTLIGDGGSTLNFIHVSNADHTRMNAEISDNIISGAAHPFLIEDTANGVVTGVNNWLKTGTAVSPLTGTVFSTSPGFRNVAAEDYTLTNNSPCIGAASAAVFGLPGREYYLNEATNRQWRIRNSASDIGAFESTTTNTPIGPYDAVPRPLLNATPSAGNGSVTVSWPLFASDFLLQQCPVGTSLTAWSNAPVTLMTNATSVAATTPMLGSGSFFRLGK